LADSWLAELQQAGRARLNYSFCTKAPFIKSPIKGRRQRFYLQGTGNAKIALLRNKEICVMTAKSALVVATALATAVIASPAFAQSRDHTGSMMPNYYSVTSQQMWDGWGPSQGATSRAPQVATGRSAQVAASVPKHLYAFVGNVAPAAGDANGPALTGGGSAGYNRNLLNY
jgi:hypothetical protein